MPGGRRFRSSYGELASRFELEPRDLALASEQQFVGMAAFCIVGFEVTGYALWGVGTSERQRMALTAATGYYSMRSPTLVLLTPALAPTFFAGLHEQKHLLPALGIAFRCRCDTGLMITVISGRFRTGSV